MTIKQLYYFMDIAHGKTYQEVSDKFFITQPALTRSMAALEQELGIALLEKDGRRVKLTPVGEIYLEYVESALSILEKGRTAIHKKGNKFKDTIMIASVYCYTYGFFPDLVRQFEAMHSDINIQLQVDFSRIVTEKVLQKKADIGIITLDESMDKYKELDYIHLMNIDIVAAFSNNHRLTNFEKCSIADLENFPLISFDENSATYLTTKKLFDDAGVEFNPYISVSDDQSALNIVQRNDYVALVLKNVAQNARDVSFIPIKEAYSNTVPFYMIARKDRINTPAIKVFESFVTDFSSEQS